MSSREDDETRPDVGPDPFDALVDGSSRYRHGNHEVSGAEARRGKLPVGALGQVEPPEGSAYHSHALRQQVFAGHLDAAFAELAAIPWADVKDRPLLVPVRDAVADELARGAANVFGRILPSALNCMGVTPIMADDIVIDLSGRMHLVRSKVLDLVAVGQRLQTACGVELFSGAEVPLTPALRGCWQVPEANTERCQTCAVYAAEFSETQERHEDDNMPAAQSLALQEEAREPAREDALHYLEQLRFIQPAPARSAIEESFREHLLEALTVRAAAQPDVVLERVLLGYAETAEEELRSINGPQLKDLLSLDDWRAAITNIIEDLLTSADASVARTYFYTELRAIIKEKTRRHRVLYGPQVQPPQPPGP